MDLAETLAQQFRRILRQQSANPQIRWAERTRPESGKRWTARWMRWWRDRFRGKITAWPLHEARNPRGGGAGRAVARCGRIAATASRGRRAATRWEGIGQEFVPDNAEALVKRLFVPDREARTASEMLKKEGCGRLVWARGGRGLRVPRTTGRRRRHLRLRTARATCPRCTTRWWPTRAGHRRCTATWPT